MHSTFIEVFSFNFTKTEVHDLLLTYCRNSIYFISYSYPLTDCLNMLSLLFDGFFVCSYLCLYNSGLFYMHGFTTSVLITQQFGLVLNTTFIRRLQSVFYL